jgi:hypothetical protein
MLSPLGARHEPENLNVAETWIKERMRHVDTIDALIDTEHWPALDSSVTIENKRDEQRKFVKYNPSTKWQVNTVLNW